MCSFLEDVRFRCSFSIVSLRVFFFFFFLLLLIHLYVDLVDTTIFFSYLISGIKLFAFFLTISRIEIFGWDLFLGIYIYNNK